MFGINSSRVSLALSATALFVALGGTALAVTQIGTNQIKNGAVTSPKIKNGAVTNSKLGDKSVSNGKLAKSAVGNGKIANNAVTGSKVKDGSLTASDVAPNTFLAATGTAANASRLGGLLPGDFVQGTGFMQQRRIVVAQGTGAIFLNTLIGAFTANCDTRRSRVSCGLQLRATRSTPRRSPRGLPSTSTASATYPPRPGRPNRSRPAARSASPTRSASPPAASIMWPPPGSTGAPRGRTARSSARSSRPLGLGRRLRPVEQLPDVARSYAERRLGADQ